MNGIGGDLGVIVMTVALAAFCGTIYLLSRRDGSQCRQRQRRLGRRRRRFARARPGRIEEDADDPLRSSAAASTGYVDWSSMWKILVISIAAGAGLVTVFSIGMVALSASGYVRSGGRKSPQPAHHVLPLVVCVVCGLIVLAGVGYGVHTIFTK